MSYSDGSISVPLLISGPPIAGLLPVRAESLVANETRNSTEHTFVYHNERLTYVSEPQRIRLVTAMQSLTDIAIAFDLGEVNEAVLRAAEARSHKEVGGTPRTSRTPQAYRAKRDADLVDWWVQTTRRLAFVRN